MLKILATVDGVSKSLIDGLKQTSILRHSSWLDLYKSSTKVANYKKKKKNHLDVNT